MFDILQGLNPLFAVVALVLLLSAVSNSSRVLWAGICCIALFGLLCLSAVDLFPHAGMAMVGIFIACGAIAALVFFGVFIEEISRSGKKPPVKETSSGVGFLINLLLFEWIITLIVWLVSLVGKALLQNKEPAPLTSTMRRGCVVLGTICLTLFGVVLLF